MIGCMYECMDVEERNDHSVCVYVCVCERKESTFIEKGKRRNGEYSWMYVWIEWKLLKLNVDFMYEWISECENVWMSEEGSEWMPVCLNGLDQ